MKYEIFDLMYTMCMEGYRTYVEEFNSHVPKSREITQTEAAYLGIISKEKMMLSELATGMEVSRPAATKLVNKLEAKGYVVKKGVDDDKRKIVIRTTAYYKEIENKAIETIYNKFEGVLTEEEVSVFEGALEKIKAKMVEKA